MDGALDPTLPTLLAASRAGARLPSGAGRARRRVRAPASRVVARELEVVALTRHPTLDGANPAPGIQPRAEGAEHGQVSVDAGCFQRNQEQASEVLGHGWRARVA